MNFQLVKLLAIFEVENDVMTLPRYKGSTFRGAFGHALKTVACTCEYKESIKNHEPYCPYGYMFETSSFEKGGVLQNNDKVPRPFLLEPPLEETVQYQYGDRISFNLTLYGEAIKFLPFVIFALEEMGKEIGRKNQTIKLRQVFCVDINNDIVKSVYHCEDRKLKNEPTIVNLRGFNNNTVNCTRSISIHMKTPVRLKHLGHYVDLPEFHIILRSAVRRITSLLYYHHDQQKVDEDFKALFKKAEEVRLIKSDVKWYDWERYSNRQKERMKLGGIIGKATYEGDLNEYISWLQIAEWTHIGKNPTFGLGKIKVVYH